MFCTSYVEVEKVFCNHEKLSDEQSGEAWRGLESLANQNTNAKGVKVVFRWWDSNHQR